MAGDRGCGWAAPQERLHRQRLDFAHTRHHVSITKNRCNQPAPKRPHFPPTLIQPPHSQRPAIHPAKKQATLQASQAGTSPPPASRHPSILGRSPTDPTPSNLSRPSTFLCRCSAKRAVQTSPPPSHHHAHARKQLGRSKPRHAGQDGPPLSHSLSLSRTLCPRDLGRLRRTHTHTHTHATGHAAHACDNHLQAGEKQAGWVSHCFVVRFRVWRGLGGLACMQEGCGIAGGWMERKQGCGGVMVGWVMVVGW